MYDVYSSESTQKLLHNDGRQDGADTMEENHNYQDLSVGYRDKEGNTSTFKDADNLESIA